MCHVGLYFYGYKCVYVYIFVNLFVGPPIIETNTVNGSSPYVLSNHDLKVL